MPPNNPLTRNETDVVEEYLLEGMPLGTMNNFPYKIKENELKQDDVILLLSDGLPELSNSVKAEFGYKRVRQEFQEVAKLKPEEIIEKLKVAELNRVNDAEPDDDITFVVIKVK